MLKTVKNYRASNSGFSLFELLVVCAFMTGLAGIATLKASQILAPSLRHYTKDLLIKINYHAALTELKRTPLEIKSFKQKSLQLNYHNKSFTLAIPKQVTLKSFNFGNLKNPASWVIRPNGTATPGRVEFRMNSSTCSLIQSLRGQRRIFCLD